MVVYGSLVVVSGGLVGVAGDLRVVYCGQLVVS